MRSPPMPTPGAGRKDLSEGSNTMYFLYKQENMPSHTGDLLWLLLLLLASMDFGGIGSTFLAMLLLFYMLVHVRQIMVTVQVILLILFSASYFVFYWYHFSADIADVLKYLIIPWSAYVAGACYVRNSERKEPLLPLILTIVTGLFLHGTLNVVSYRFFHRVDERYARIAYDFWRQDYISVTNHGLLFLIPAAVSVGMLLSGKRKWILPALIMLTLSTYNAIQQAYRTYFAVFGILALGAIGYLLFSVKISTNKRLSIIAGAIVLLILCIILWNLDAAGIRSAVLSSRLYRRMTQGDLMSAGGRVNIWKSFFDSWLQYPFGGEKIELYGGSDYVHNFWLDIYRVAGVFPFLFSLAATIAEAVTQWRYIKENRSTHTAIITTCLTAAVLINLMVEPVYNANPYIYFYFLMIQGGIFGAMRRDKSET